MLIDRPNIVEGSSIQNATVASGSTPPANPSPGELFYNTTLSQLQTYTGATWDTVPSTVTFSAHTSDTALHLTSTQNTLLDGLNVTLTSTELNYVDGVTSSIQTQLNNNVTAITNEVTRATTVEGNLQTQITNITGGSGTLTVHIADMGLHLTSAQNTFLDGLTYPGVLADVNSIPTLTSGLNTVTSNYNAHAASTSVHINANQNTFLDGISYGTVGFADINHLNGLDGFLGSGVALQTYLSDLNTNKLNRSGSQPMLGDLSMGGHSITGLAAPVAASDAATKDYVDQLQQGLHWKDAALVATTANIALSTLQTIDGVLVASNNRVLVKNQTNQAENGVYLASSGAWSRATDANTATELDGMAIFVRSGTVHADTAWVQVNALVTFPGDPISYSQFAAAGGATAGSGIQITGSVISVRHGDGLTFSGQDLTLAVSARFNLGTSLDLATLANGGGGSLLKFTRDTYGRVSGTSAVTSADLTGLLGTTYVLRGGDTMTGPLSGTSITGTSLTSTGTLGVTGISTLGVVNIASMASAGNITVGTPGTEGYMILTQGNAANPGYIGFHTLDAVRRGYVGWNDGTSHLLLASENGWAWEFNVTPDVNGAPILHSTNFNTYAPTLTGTGASGTWGINITGNAATATATADATNASRYIAFTAGATGAQGLLTDAGLRYNPSTNILTAAVSGNATTATTLQTARTIDISGVTATATSFNGSANIVIPITAVPASLLTGTVAAARLTGTYAIDISGDAATVDGFSAQVASGANTIPVRNGSGYLFGNFINMTDGSLTSGVSGIIAKNATDDYYRTATAAAVATFISGQTMSINGNASTASNVSSISNAVGNAYSWTGQQSFISSSNTGIANASGTLMPQATNSSTAATISFHRPSAFGLNMGLDNDNVFRIGGWSAAANRMQLDMSGNVTFAGDVTAFSDRRVKTDIKPLEDALAKVERLQGVSFTRIDSGERGIGVIAQDMQLVVPEVVKEDNDGNLSVAYGNLVGLLIEAIKELKAEVQTLKAKVQS
jgi:hypothetical protein